MRFPAGCRQHFFPAGLRERTAREMNWLARENCVFQHCLRAFLRAFLFCSSTFFVRIPTVFRHCLTRKRTQEEHIMRAFLLHFYYFPALSSVRISTVFQHCRRAFLLCSSTQCCTQCTQCCALLRRNACTQCWNPVGIRTKTLHFYFAPTLFVCIFLLWSNILSQKPYFPLEMLHLSQQASYPTLVREYEGDKHGRVVLLVT